MPEPTFVPGAGIAVVLLIRWLSRVLSEHAAPAEAPRRVIITPPSRIITPLPVQAKQLLPSPAPAPPVVRWTSDRELLAWRAWRLAILLHDDKDRIGPRLLSLSAPCVWDGPGIRADVVPAPDAPGGICALKANLTDTGEWRLSEYCWVTGSVALSGRVVEHDLGYRAERAVIRELRLGVATHLATRQPEILRNLIGRLEDRYQAPVDAGLPERDIADRILARGFAPRVPELPLMTLREPWVLAQVARRAAGSLGPKGGRSDGRKQRLSGGRMRSSHPGSPTAASLVRRRIRPPLYPTDA